MKNFFKLFSILVVSLNLMASNDFEKDLYNLTQNQKEKLEAKEIIVSIVNNKTNKVVYANNKDLSADYTFEPASIMKPLVLSLVLKEKKVKNDEVFYAYNEFSLKKENNKYSKVKNSVDKNGYYPKGELLLNKRWIVRDDKKLKKHYLSLEEVITHSSNIGYLQIANRLSADELYFRLKNLGFANGVGKIPTIELFKKDEDKYEFNVYKTVTSYGQGLTVSFNQILNAYIALDKSNNKIINNGLKKYAQVYSKAKEKFPNLNIAFQTGTSQIAQKGKYTKKYISSIFGFVKSENNSYTIGITVIEPISTGKNWYYHYASQSAQPLFYDFIKQLQKQNYLN